MKLSSLDRVRELRATLNAVINNVRVLEGSPVNGASAIFQMTNKSTVTVYIDPEPILLIALDQLRNTIRHIRDELTSMGVDVDVDI